MNFYLIKSFNFYLIISLSVSFFFYYVTYADTLAFNVLHTCKDFMPNFTADYSPFSVRVRPGKRRETLMGTSKLPPPNPSVSGHVSTSSTSSSASELESDPEEEDANTDTNMTNYMCINGNDETEESFSYQSSPVRTFETVLTTCEKSRYGTLFTTPKKRDLALYEKYVNIGVHSGEIKNKPDHPSVMIPVKFISTFSSSTYSDSSFSIDPPKVSKQSLQIYQDYVARGIHGASTPNRKSFKLYKNYLVGHERVK